MADTRVPCRPWVGRPPDLPSDISPSGSLSAPSPTRAGPPRWRGNRLLCRPGTSPRSRARVIMTQQVTRRAADSGVGCGFGPGVGDDGAEAEAHGGTSKPPNCKNTELLDLGLEHGAQHGGLLKDGSLPTFCRSRAVSLYDWHESDSKIVRNIASLRYAGSCLGFSANTTVVARRRCTYSNALRGTCQDRC
jgi:hypothetical protein